MDKWARIAELFEAALKVPPDQRAALLERLCPEDPAVRQEVLHLLDHREQLGEETRTQPMLPFQVDDVVAGRYRIVRPLGAGGMGIVFKAKDLHLDGIVALKTLIDASFQSDESEARFRREITLARRVTHPNVCRIHDFGRHAHASLGELPFLTMEFIPGGTLSARLHEQGRLSAEECYRILRQIACGLAAAHEMGIVHRDLKCMNIMLDAGSGELRAKITDFGIARSVLKEERPGATNSRFIGTPAYAAPEQFRGEATKASDVYSLGVITYEVLTGERPSAGLSPAMDDRWKPIVAKCLALDPRLRFQDAGELLVEIDRVFGGTSGSVTRPAGSGAGLRYWLGAGVFLVLLSTALFAWHWRTTHVVHHPPPEAQRWFNDAQKAFSFGDYSTATRELQAALEIDPAFSLARARLAAAWAELDFEEKADQEMLAATASQYGLNELDHMYVDAVRALLIHDYKLSAAEFRTIAERTTDAERKAVAFLDLGRLLERAGEIEDSVRAYTEASKVTPELPAPYLRLAVLRSRQGRAEDAAPNFDAAQKRYEMVADREGLAELAYERMVAAISARDYAAARRYLRFALEEARQIGNPQLEARARNRLSSIEYGQSHDDAAIAAAKDAIGFANGHGIPYWETDARIRLGVAYTYQSQGDSESNLLQAMQQAKDNRWDRLVALSELSLASLRGEQGRSKERGDLAAAAAKYYRRNGFLGESLQALNLELRSERDAGHLQEALASSRGALEVLKQYRSPGQLVAFEEATGTILSQMGDFPQALSHYEAALAAAKQAGTLVEWEHLNSAEILWQLGRYGEANAELAMITPESLKTTRFAAGVDRLKVSMWLSQGKFAPAAKLAKTDLDKYSGVKADLDIALALCKLHLGSPAEGIPLVTEALQSAEGKSDPLGAARAKLARAEVFFGAGEYQESEADAKAALAFYISNNNLESEWQAFHLLAQGEKALHHSAESQDFAKKAVDVLDLLSNNWGSPAYLQYANRPDVAIMRADLLALRQ